MCTCGRCSLFPINLALPILPICAKKGEIHLRIDSAQIGRLMEEITPWDRKPAMHAADAGNALMRHYQEEVSDETFR